MTNPTEIFDVLGVGFGPSNLALAIALQERALSGAASPNAVFLEGQSSFAWHPDMLLENSDMQVSFIKDLVSLRNPASTFSFLSYLHDKNRLERFINRKSFFPSRHEFNDYLEWAANRLGGVCQYDQRVIGVEPMVGTDGQVRSLSVLAENSGGDLKRYATRDLVLAIGGRPLIPDVFSPFVDDRAVVHSSTYLSTVKPLLNPAKPMKIAVIGSGQSGAEIFYDLVNDPARPQVDLVFRSHALKPSDDSPFVNEIFNADFTSFVFQQPPERRRALMEEYSNTNYSVVDGDLIEQIYGIFYEQDVTDRDDYELLRSTLISEVRNVGDQISLKLESLEGATVETRDYDLVILATGFERRIGETLLADLKDYVTDFSVGRTYQIPTIATFEPRLFVQGYSEQTHGLSDTLLSVLSVRVDEIASELMDTGQGANMFMSVAE